MSDEDFHEMRKQMNEILSYCKLIDLNYKTVTNAANLQGQQLTNIYNLLISQAKPPPPGPGGSVEAVETKVSTSLTLPKQQEKIAVAKPALKKKPEIVRKYPIEQRILYEDGKKTVGASFVIKGFATQIEGKTNLQGKWMANLAPGEYDVTVVKYGTEDKPAINLAYKIEVLAGGPVELPEYKVKSGA